ncbi:hypothetical protein FB562_0770 [Homoserinimonas aerilata]|uniref:Uncharacterized protein n=1 Tax=Homoserinimonas aerilata TaxID=1162970 RepID=A0A542YHZ9_9MICO|nr:hypothetical protein [Homoserinimonas aerilata]TQL47702.1 hypothetical protein FB562_0770 [Homoserinimonas aerilata]
MITLDFAPGTASAAHSSTSGIVLVPLASGMWRVTRPDGEVLGYVDAVQAADGERFRAKRISARLRRFVVIGEFWRMDEALECFTMG